MPITNKRGRAAEKDVQLDWAKSFEIPDKVISLSVICPLQLICAAIHFILTKDVCWITLMQW